jgi:hypothetical protein
MLARRRRRQDSIVGGVGKRWRRSKVEEEGEEEDDGRIKTLENFKLLISTLATCVFLSAVAIYRRKLLQRNKNGQKDEF